MATGLHMTESEVVLEHQLFNTNKINSKNFGHVPKRCSPALLYTEEGSRIWATIVILIFSTMLHTEACVCTFHWKYLQVIPVALVNSTQHFKLMQAFRLNLQFYWRSSTEFGSLLEEGRQETTVNTEENQSEAVFLNLANRGQIVTICKHICLQVT